MKTITGLMLASLLALAILPSSAAAQPCGGGMEGRMMMHRHHGMMPFPMMHGLGLTADQHAKVHEIMKSHHTQLESLFKQLRAGKEQISTKLMTPGQVSAGDFAPIIQRNAQVEQQIAEETLKMSLEIRALLTPDQLKKAAQVQEKMKQIQSEMKSLFGDEPPPPPPPQS